MYAERLVPRLHEAEDLQAMDMRSVPTAQKAKVAAAKIAAGKQIERLRAVLFPEDDDG
jgi:hypothetical protein